MKKGQTPFTNSSNSGFQQQSFAHLLYRQGQKDETNKQDNNLTSPFKQQNFASNGVINQGNTNTVSVASFPNEGINNMSQNIFK